MNSTLKPYEIIILAAGAVMLIFSFLDWYSAEGFGVSAWGGDFGLSLFPLATIAPLCGVIMAVVVALRAFANVDLPDRVVGFTWPQIHLVLAIYAALVMLHFLLAEKGDASFGIGFWLNLLGAIALVVGAVMMRQDADAGAGAGPAGPPQAF